MTNRESDLSTKLEKAHEKIAQLEEDNLLLRRKIENHKPGFSDEILELLKKYGYIKEGL